MDTENRNRDGGNYDNNKTWGKYTLSSATGSGQVKYMATPFFDFYMTTGHVL